MGAALLLDTTGNALPAQVAFVAALLHLVNHAAFKTLGFLAAGSVLRGAGVRDLDELGGLARRMPATSLLFGISALGAASLPLGAGFVSEWLLLQSLIHPLPTSGAVVAFTMPLAVGAVALTAGLGVTAMVKAFGIGFLARPRSVGAANAREAAPSMLAAMGVGAVACTVLAVAPAMAEPLLRIQIRPGRKLGPSLGWWLRLPGVGGSIAPSLLAVSFGVAMVVALGLVAIRPVRARRAPLWACGGGQLTARMQYTATSFAEPLQRVFDDVLRPDVDIDITHTAESRYLLEKVRYHNRIGDTVEARLYVPVVRAVTGWANLVRRAHVGSVHVYLGFGAFGLLVALVIAR
jgi:NADH:ubiquinone oxidoreductase subunit 5 (subunit L)/multisubunit Na+/H+ antiporter MnhA subunit